MAVRALITGATGFAGRHLVAHCRDAGDEVIELARSAFAPTDLLDASQTREAVSRAAPDVVYHLAAQSHVGESWRDPAYTLAVNSTSTLNLLEAVRLQTPEAAVLVASSGEVYGAPDALPVAEDAPLRPQNPYAVSKASADLLAGFYADGHGLNVVRARAFNHAGPGQPPSYAVSNLAHQFATSLQAGNDPVRIVTGNPATRRDYTDVRDVVRAYRLLVQRGCSGIYNVCSGSSASTADLVSALAQAARARAEHVADPALIRPNEVLEIRGSCQKLSQETGWQPELELEQTLRDALDGWRRELAA